MKATDVLFRRYRKLTLTTKDVNKGYYKGSRTGSMGRHTKHGGYIIEWHKVRTYVVPDLKDFKLTPFVTAAVRKRYGDYTSAPDGQGPRSPWLYLSRWKSENGYD